MQCLTDEDLPGYYELHARHLVPGLRFRPLQYFGTRKRFELFESNCRSERVKRSENYVAGYDEIVHVIIPHPSPCLACCNCLHGASVHAETHEETCPVSPSAGRHGGMRPWPEPRQDWCRWAPYRFNGIGWRAISKQGYVVRLVTRENLESLSQVARHRGWCDNILMSFFYPPLPERPILDQRLGWDPLAS